MQVVELTLCKWYGGERYTCTNIIVTLTRQIRHLSMYVYDYVYNFYKILVLSRTV